MRGNYLKEYNVKVYDGTNINFIKWDMMSILKKILHLVMTDVTKNGQVTDMIGRHNYFQLEFSLKKGCLDYKYQQDR